MHLLGVSGSLRACHLDPSVRVKPVVFLSWVIRPFAVKYDRVYPCKLGVFAMESNVDFGELQESVTSLLCITVALAAV